VTGPSPHFTPLFRGVCTSEKLAALPDDSCRLLYALLLANADSWGRQDGRPAIVNAAAWPLLWRSVEETVRCLDALESVGLIQRHEREDGRPYLVIPDWEEKAGLVGRRSHRRASEYPDPPVAARECPAPPSRARTPEPNPEPNPERRVAASQAPPRPPALNGKASKPRKPRTDDQGLALAHFEARYLERYETPYAFADRKDGALLKRMVETLAKGSLDECRSRIDRAFDDPWRCEHGIDLGTIVSQWAKLVPLKRPPRKKTAAEQALADYYAEKRERGEDDA
jgi:hypothetical protein